MATALIPIDSADDPRIAEFRDIRERDMTGREHRFIAEGTVVLRMLARSHMAGGRFSAEKILLLRNRVAGLSDILDVFAGDVPVYVADAAVLHGIVGFDLHRGVLALGKRTERDDSLIERLPARSLVLVACGISNHDNIGAMFRNAAAFGADAMLLDDRCCDPLYRKALRVSVGAVLDVPYQQGGSAPDLLSRLAELGFDILALSPAGRDDIRAIGPHDRIALVLGTEGEGLPASVLAQFKSVRIPQAPGLDSLNVGTATGVALYALASSAGRL